MGTGRGMGRRARWGAMPGAEAEVTNIDGGIRLELEPNDPSQLDDLRQHARWHQQRMSAGACWWLQPQEEDQQT